MGARCVGVILMGLPFFRPIPSSQTTSARHHKPLDHPQPRFPFHPSVRFQLAGANLTPSSDSVIGPLLN